MLGQNLFVFRATHFQKPSVRTTMPVITVTHISPNAIQSCTVLIIPMSCPSNVVLFFNNPIDPVDDALYCLAFFK
jgi:hypothetical protein